ncbi:lysozyme-like domain-containing protein [Halteromyces radiatus]|uniref:lysozyme-like domain-containing protein n=1 Tax=Halteromyces radiatus TaxID=101107 RepID=UPI0022208B28|nr:lysozyme-like domain-containing protein [Halteromyces radiatus]KAI8086702.1 lysozyme-like domain-containing protein [Halteromyces radiatus]
MLIVKTNLLKHPKTKPHKVHGGVKQTNCTTFYDISKLPSEDIDDHTLTMAQLITNVFENGNTQMGYSAASDIGDCRGYTCGYIGFTTGTNDAYAVVEQYGHRKHKNPFEPYLDELKKLSSYEFNDPRRADTSKLDGFASLWTETACTDPSFVQTQLDVGHAMYMKPALKYAASVDVKSNLGKALFYDTIVQHGWQYVEPLINLPRILEITGPREKDESEKSFLTRFLTTRRQLVCCYPGKVWNDSSDRMSDLQNLVDDWEKNKDLTDPVHLVKFDVTVTGKESISFDKAGCKKASKRHRYRPFTHLPSADDLPIPQCPDTL